MNDGYVRCAAATPKVTVADPQANVAEIEKMVREMAAQHVQVMVFPELCISSYDCRDLFAQEMLLRASYDALLKLVRETADVDALIFVGLPLEADGKLYNVAAAISHGRILGFIPKSHIPNYREFYEMRHFEPGHSGVEMLHGIPFGTNLIFEAQDVPHLKAAAEICEDLWVPNPPSTSHALAGATLIVNLSASDAVVGKDSYRRQLVRQQSASLICGYVYASSGDGESTTDLVFDGHDLIAENGVLLTESSRFINGFICADVDMDLLVSERRRMTTYPAQRPDGYQIVPFRLNGVPSQEKKKDENEKLLRFVDPHPFVPEKRSERDARCREILTIQAMGLKKRLEHTHCTHAVVGISGGLDSTLALLVTVRAFDLLGIDRKGILAVTMPGFGTTDRTYTNALNLIKELGATLKEVSIVPAVRQHFEDIGQDESVHDVTYENCQARERTQILMDLANKCGGMVIGTGDLSELALGWATYNGDHMSMYAVNASVPKTLVRYLVRYEADTCGDKALSDSLLDVLDTPVSPELLPPEEDGTIAQKTEDLVGPYELHDFFLYQILRFGFMPGKVYRLALQAFYAPKEERKVKPEPGTPEVGHYSKETIKKWLKNFYRRFFAQQFKRSCLPDGPKVGSVTVSPRGDLRMPSDAQVRMWLDEVEKL